MKYSPRVCSIATECMQNNTLFALVTPLGRLYIYAMFNNTDSCPSFFLTTLPSFFHHLVAEKLQVLYTLHATTCKRFKEELAPIVVQIKNEISLISFQFVSLFRHLFKVFLSFPRNYTASVYSFSFQRGVIFLRSRLF